jgi:ubiquinone/menaquinone biosynthesis C-methylase UbiE
MSIFLQNKKLYAAQAKDYAEVSYWGHDENQLAKKYFRKGKLLVLGCGAGRTLKPLIDMGFTITAIDIVPEMVAKAREKMKEYDIEIFEMDAASLMLDSNSFDTVFFPFHGIDYVSPDIYAAVAEARRVMKPDGVFIFSSHNRLYLKKLHRFFKGKYDDYEGLKTYRTDPFDVVGLKKYFKKVVVIQKISLVSRESANWKDKLYLLFPWLNKTTYFICLGKND